MRDASVRSVALRAAGLSVESLAAVQAVIDHARRLEGLADEAGPAGQPSAEGTQPITPAGKLVVDEDGHE